MMIIRLFNAGWKGTRQTKILRSVLKKAIYVVLWQDREAEERHFAADVFMQVEYVSVGKKDSHDFLCFFLIVICLENWRWELLLKKQSLINQIFAVQAEMFTLISSVSSNELTPLLDSLSIGEIGDFCFSSRELWDISALGNSKTSMLRAIYK